MVAVESQGLISYTKGNILKIVRKLLSELHPAEYNPRKDLQPGDPEYEKLKKSIMSFDCVEPIVWNETSGNVVGGHQRIKVLEDLGYSEIEVSVVNLDDQKEKALNLALNKISGDWEQGMLESLITDLSMDVDFDIELTGFDLGEVADFVVDLPDDNKDIDEGEMADTENECPKCGFEW